MSRVHVTCTVAYRRQVAGVLARRAVSIAAERASEQGGRS